MKTIRSMVLAMFTFLASFKVFQKKNVQPQLEEQKFIPSMKDLFKDQQMTIDTTLNFLRALPKNKLTPDMIAHANFIANIQTRILADQNFDPNHLHSALLFCQQIRNMQPIQ